jgi:AAHS family 4-hydroxybenzoate transporter-like MFS transporter
LPTPNRPVVDVHPLIESQKAGRFWVSLLAVTWSVAFLDGFDLQIISFAGRYIKEDFSLSNTQLGTLGTLGVVGTLLGAIAVSYLGDRVGRRPAILTAVAGFGVFMILFALAENYTQLMILRVVAGVFIGGALPPIWALVTEFAPTRLRSTSVVIVMIGYSLGTAAGGPISNALIPDLGWESVFVVGGIASVLVLVFVALWLPESIKFLVQKDIAPHRIAPVLRRLRPGITVPQDAVFRAGVDAPDRTKFTPASLFRGGRLAIITPLIWLSYLSSATIVFYLTFWGPILNEELGFSVSAAALLAAGGSVAGAIGQIIAGRFIDRRGAGTIAVLPLLAIPALLVIAFVHIGPAAYIVVLTLAHMLIVGGHGGIISITGIFYRPAIRSSGGGWATSVSKLGAMLGPWLAGVLLDGGMDARGTFFVFAFFPVAMVIAMTVLGRIQRGLPATADGSLHHLTSTVDSVATGTPAPSRAV